MAAKHFQKITEAELEILQILWKYRSATVKQVNDILNEKREVGYTTTLKMMQLMNDKGLLERDTENKSHVYYPALSEEDGKHMMLDKLVESAFGGSAMNLVLQTLGNYKTSKKELDQIKKIIKELEGKTK